MLRRTLKAMLGLARNLTVARSCARFLPSFSPATRTDLQVSQAPSYLRSLSHSVPISGMLLLSCFSLTHSSGVTSIVSSTGKPPLPQIEP